MKSRSALAYGLAAVLTWSTVAAAFKLALRHVGPVELLAWSSLCSTLVLLVAVTLLGKWRALMTFSRRDLLLSVPLGIMNPCLYYLVLFQAYDRLPAQEAQPLNYTWAIVLAFLSIPILGHRLRLRDVLAALICYAGVIWIATRGDPMSLEFSDGAGVALALGSTVIWATYWLINTRSKRDPTAGLFLNFAFGLPFVVGAWAVFGPVRIPSAGGLLGCAYVGVFEMGVSFLLWLAALKRTTNASKIGNLIFLSPFLSLIFIQFVADEKILLSSIVGIVLIIAGLVLQNAGKREKFSS